MCTVRLLGLSGEVSSDKEQYLKSKNDKCILWHRILRYVMCVKRKQLLSTTKSDKINVGVGMIPHKYVKLRLYQTMQYIAIHLITFLSTSLLARWVYTFQCPFLCVCYRPPPHPAFWNYFQYRLLGKSCNNKKKNYIECRFVWFFWAGWNIYKFFFFTLLKVYTCYPFNIFSLFNFI